MRVLTLILAAFFEEALGEVPDEADEREDANTRE
jgi:hypothetical protein